MAILALASLVLSCERCASKALPDAGAAAPAPSPRAMDLKTAMILVYPEFRFSTLEEGRASMRRRLRWRPEAPLAEALAAEVRPNGFVPVDGGADGALAVRPPFEIRARQAGGEVEVEIGLPIAGEEISKLLQTPAPLGSEQLAVYLPRPKGAERVEETFSFLIRYKGREDRVARLVRQMVDLLLQGGWRASSLPEGWAEDGGVPAAFSLELSQAHTGATVHVGREGEHVRAELLLRVWPPAPGGSR